MPLLTMSNNVIRARNFRWPTSFIGNLSFLVGNVRRLQSGCVPAEDFSRSGKRQGGTLQHCHRWRAVRNAAAALSLALCQPARAALSARNSTNQTHAHSVIFLGKENVFALSRNP